MPYMTVVTLADADGDEFPIAFAGRPDSDETAELLALRRVQQLMAEESRFRPVPPFTVTRIEYPPELT